MTNAWELAEAGARTLRREVNRLSARNRADARQRILRANERKMRAAFGIRAKRRSS